MNGSRCTLKLNANCHGCTSELSNQRLYQLPLKKSYAHLLGPSSPYRSPSRYFSLRRTTTRPLPPNPHMLEHKDIVLANSTVFGRHEIRNPTFYEEPHQVIRPHNVEGIPTITCLSLG